VIEDDELVIQPEKQVRDAAVVGRRGRELLALVVADRVVAGVADQAARERGQVGGVVVLARREELREVGQRVGRVEAAGLAGGHAVGGGLLDRRLTAGHLVHERRPGGDEAVAGDLLAADDALEQKRVRLAPQHLERADRREPVGEQLPVDGDDLGVPRRERERFEVGEVPPHDGADCRNARNRR
jgi:hypothetical protein